MVVDADKKLKDSFRMEMIGAGMYRGLANQYRKQDSDLSRRFLKFSRQEAMHGGLFQKYFLEKTGQDLRFGFFWKTAGRLAAVLMRPLPLRKKMKKLHVLEQQAVYNIEKALSEDLDRGYRKIMETILPHEKTHAALYVEVFSD